MSNETYLSLTFASNVWFCSIARLGCEKKRLCDYKVMARVPDKIKLIDGSREALKLSVRITDLWFIGIPEKFEQAEMVVVDSDGDEIHVVCKQDQLKSWKADLKENLTYVMHNFKVMKNDVIGVVDEVVFRYVSSKNTKVIFKLKDLSGQVLSCTLWENYCLQFLSYLNEVEDERPIIILLTHARIKEAQGSYLPSVSNSFKASKLMINELVLEIQELRERLLDLGMEKIVCVTVAKITTIHGAIRLAVNVTKKTDIETVSFICPCGKDNDQPVLRYRVEVMVNHKGEQTKFLLWDREYAELIGQSADEVNRLKIEDDDVDLNASPQALDRLLGCFLAFKVKVQPRFRNVVVLKYSDESNLINVVLDMLPDSEPCCKIESSILESTDPTELEYQSVSVTADDDRSMLDSTEPTELESQSVSITADHDPLLRIPLTPTKRVSSDELDDEPKNFEISLAQVSSNNLAKHCQAE
ncbi:uncharacterized protein [Glycine max]|uniref:uncharacterized protein n=1 Tax=Glycine max TaxID=3847 RepID=UPI0003DE86EA|nr:uncharacterized protein LOC102666291 [Glycine max]|eukprot:XP_006586434.1 uncharacterized protein LOC102666291 [Glycine max]